MFITKFNIEILYDKEREGNMLHSTFCNMLKVLIKFALMVDTGYKFNVKKIRINGEVI